MNWLNIFSRKESELSIEDKRQYFQLIELHNQNRIDYNDRKWETIKFFQGIYTALITAMIAALIVMYRFELIDNWLLRIFISLFPILSIISINIGIKNINRESNLLFLEESQMFKIAKYIDLDTVIPIEKRWFSGDQYLLHEKWRNSNFQLRGGQSPDTYNSWVEERIKVHNFSNIFSRFFNIEIVISILSIIIILFGPFLLNQINSNKYFKLVNGVEIFIIQIIENFFLLLQ